MLSTADIDRFLANPSEYFDFSLTKMIGLSRGHLEELQIAGLKRRFGHFRGRLAMLDKLADSQNVNKIDELNDVLPVLFSHEVYKSYPASLLEKHRYAQLTAWLNKLTTHDLSAVDVSACKSIDDWMMTLERETPMAVCHTSGTTGTMSFLPTARSEWRNRIAQYPTSFFQKFGEDPVGIPPGKVLPLNIPCIYPYYRTGGLSFLKALTALVDIVAGSEEMFHTAYPGRLSADLLLLAAKLRAAKDKGKLDEIKISPELIARRDEFEAAQRDMPRRLSEFFDTMRTRLTGQRVCMQAATNMLYAMAESGLKQGVRKIFAPDSVIITGGGAKGTILPDDWRIPVKEFFGVEQVHVNYGMSELAGQFTACEHGNSHSVPWLISYILDPGTMQPLPRKGSVSGQFACYDLLADSHWGGFVSGDEVTMEWDAACSCGRTTPYLHGKIQRISERRSNAGEEKITCAATPQAYSEALDFLNDGAV
jgi:hypothetical protein